MGSYFGPLVKLSSGKVVGKLFHGKVVGKLFPEKVVVGF
jgi:hypothetical protein